jgi:serine-type D-Ala-D-Ala carboxypeptidase/endopeptidase (penicillin-binding protein 4)
MRIALPFLILLSVAACSPVSKSALNKKFQATETKFQDHVGFSLYDPEKGKTVFEYNGDKYFTPASNTKIFTLYASVKILGDSVPALTYVENSDSIILWGTGDPSFLYKNVFNNFRAYDFLKAQVKPIYLSNSNFRTAHFGSGWAWDDYNSEYSVEKTHFPIFGNAFQVKIWNEKIFVQPTMFDTLQSRGDSLNRRDVIRDVNSNRFKIHPGRIPTKQEDWSIPIRLDHALVCNLLADTLKKVIVPISKQKPAATKTFFSIPADSLYRELMQDSDNFIAEQLLLMCADVLSDTLQPEITIKYAKDNLLKDLQDVPKWVDGSGLSRYNLFTPRSIVQMWRKIEEVKPRQQLLPLLATGGKYGTIKNWYKSDKPYIFGKTGTLSNNHSLSGYLVTRSGKTLIFSFMSNNFLSPMNQIRTNMQEILYTLYEKY